MSMKKFQWHHWESNQRLSVLLCSASTNCATAFPPVSKEWANIVFSIRITDRKWSPYVRINNIRNYVLFFLPTVLLLLCALLLNVVGLLCILLLLCVLPCLLMYIVLLCVYYFSCRMLARSQYPEGPTIGHLGTGFSWFPCVYKQMLRWFPRLQVATACFSCSPPDLNFLDPYFIFMYTH